MNTADETAGNDKIQSMDMADEIAGNYKNLSIAGIKFGTDGWRATIGEHFTFDNVGRVAQAYAQHLLDRQGKKVVVGYDTRFMAAKFARRAAEVLAANGLEVHLARSYIPTPVLSFAVLHLQADGGLMITASHHPPEFLGVKIKGSYGGDAPPETIAEVEQKLGAKPKWGEAVIHSFDLRKAYYEFIASQLDMDALRAYDGVLYHDSLGGAGAGWLAGFVRHAGLRLELRELHAVPDPMFYGVNPEPAPQNLFSIMTVLRAEEGPTFAAINDGDAGRIGAVLSGGGYFGSHQIFTVMLKHLHSKGLRGRVVRTAATSSLIDRLAHHLGLEQVVTPIGFNHIAQEMLRGGVLIGGDESGGIGVTGHIPERDGIFNALLLLESVALTGKSLGQQMAEIENELGFRHAYDRVQLQLPTMEQIRVAMTRVRTPPKAIAGLQVSGTEHLDGIKWLFGQAGWLLFKACDLEPVLHLYCEAQDDRSLKAILDEARKLVSA
jgi:phosphomannomutase